MILRGKVINLLPSLAPNRAIIRIDNWDDSLTVPLGQLKIGQRVEIEVRSPLATRSATPTLPSARPSG